MCDYKPCFVCGSFKSFSPLWLPSAMLLVFKCRVDEIEVQIISNIRLVLLFWLSCAHAHTHAYTLGCILASVSGKTICGSETGTQELWRKFREPRRNLLRHSHTCTHNRTQCMEGYLRSISLCTVPYTKELQKRTPDSEVSLPHSHFHKNY